jgi:phage/plasmid-associated DNA primase
MNENIPLKFGTIKSVVSGSEITVRRKYKTSLTFSPRAKHTWICNHYPNITDRSEGTLRRLVPLNFDIQIPEDQRRPEFKEPSWWIEKGNMSGVLNWALEGMKRLSQNDWKFNIPEASKEIKETIRVDSQPELQFFDQHLQFGTGPTFIVSVSQLYEAYMLWMKGQKNALKQINLTKAFKRRYPQIEHREKTTNPLWSGEQRYFVGVRLINQPKSNSYPGLHQNAVNGYQPTVPDSRVDETVEKLASVEKQVKKQSNIQSDMGNAIEGMMKVIVRMLNQYNIPLNIDEFRNEVLKEMGPPSGIDEYTIQS